MSDGVLNNPQDEIHILINLVGLMKNAVRSYRDKSTWEIRAISSLGHDVVLVWGCQSHPHAVAQAEILWDRSIPARIITDPAEESAFIDRLTGGHQDGV